MIEVKSEVIKGREWVYRAMLATMGKKPKKGGFLRDDVWFFMLRAMHSCIEEYEIWVDAIVPDRVHQHIVRHEEIGKYVQTSRPDINGKQLIIDGELHRRMSLRINAKRLIEIAAQRLCLDAWLNSQIFIAEIIDSLQDEILKKMCVKPCVNHGICIGKKKCGYIFSSNFEEKRQFFINFE